MQLEYIDLSIYLHHNYEDDTPLSDCGTLRVKLLPAGKIDGDWALDSNAEMRRCSIDLVGVVSYND